MKRISAIALIVLMLGTAEAQAEQILHYMFHNNAYDASGHGNDGTVVGSPSYVYETSTSGISFNNPTGDTAATQFVRLPDLTSQINNGSFTVAIKYRTTDSSGNNGRLFGNTWVNSGLVLNYNAANRPAPNGLVASGGQYGLFGNFDPNGTPVTTNGQYHMAVLTVQHDLRTTTFYVDNQLVSAGNIDFWANPSWANVAVGALGATLNGENHYGAKAVVEDLQVYNNYMNQTEAFDLVNKTGFLTNNTPSNQMRFSNATQANNKRTQLKNYIWSNGLPTSTMPSVNLNVPFPTTDLNGLNQSLVSSVDRLDANVSGTDFHATSYLIHPTNAINANKMLIVAQGHSSNTMDYGVRGTIEKALQQGYTVAAMAMPLMGWNTDTTLNVNGTNYSLTYGDHNSIFTTLKDAMPDGSKFKLFLEPVVQTVNYFKSLAGAGDVGMTGISGGGWTTHFLAALDERIKFAAPVSGSAPLYSRNQYGPDFIGDAPEQYYTPLFREDIATDGSGGGVATWEEIYALGGYGTGRKEVMMTSLNDNICFYGSYADAFKDVVANKVSSLGAGVWQYYGDPHTSTITNSDGFQTTHFITDTMFYNYILPGLANMGLSMGDGELVETPEPATALLLAMGGLGLVAYAWRKRRGA